MLNRESTKQNDNIVEKQKKNEIKLGIRFVWQKRFVTVKLQSFMCSSKSCKSRENKRVNNTVAHYVEFNGFGEFEIVDIGQNGTNNL